MRKLPLLITVLLLFAFSAVKAQDYDKGLGLRGGVINGITYKQFTSEQGAVELIAGFREELILLTGLFERHVPALNMDGFYWYYGAGGHVGSFDNDNIVGVDGIGGLAYRIPELPIVLSADVKPLIEFTDPELLWDAGFSVRYTF